jgi:hypothetical protein
LNPSPKISSREIPHKISGLFTCTPTEHCNLIEHSISKLSHHPINDIQIPCTRFANYHCISRTVRCKKRKQCAPKDTLRTHLFDLRLSTSISTTSATFCFKLTPPPPPNSTTRYPLNPSLKIPTREIPQ